MIPLSSAGEKETENQMQKKNGSCIYGQMKKTCMQTGIKDVSGIQAKELETAGWIFVNLFLPDSAYYQRL